MVQCWVKSSQVFRIFGLWLLVLFVLLALSGGGSVRGLGLEETYRASLKRKVDAFFGEGEFEKFVKKHLKLGFDESGALEEIAEFFRWRTLEKWQDKAWREGTEAPPYWWETWMTVKPDEDFYYRTAPGCSISGEYIYDEASPEFQQQALEFLQKLQQAVRTNDKEAFSKLVAVPMYWYLNRVEYIALKTPEDIISNFDRILYPEMKREVLNLKLEDVDILKKNFFTYILVDRGVFWLQCDWRIYTASPPIDVRMASPVPEQQDWE